MSADLQYDSQKEGEKEKSIVIESDHEPDGIHDGLIFPTEEERLTLRRVPDSIPWNAYCKFAINVFS